MSTGVNKRVLRKRTMAGNVLTFSDSTFQKDVLESPEPVLVDFWAPWCGPCRMIAPTIDAVATDFSGKARVGKVNTDENPQYASQLGVTAIPTVLLFKGGEIVSRFVGVVEKDKLTAALTEALG
jgi:thioredoxin 1